MMAKNIYFLLSLLLISPATLWAQQNPYAKFYGTWQLVAIYQQTEDGKKQNGYGDNPTGYLNYTADGHVMTIIVKDHRKKPVSTQITSEEALNLINSMTSYAGTYTIQGNKVVHHITVSWNQTWTGTDQIRNYEFREGFLFLSMLPYYNAVGKKTVITLQWKKLEKKRTNAYIMLKP